MEIICACNKKILPQKARFHLRLAHYDSISTFELSIHYLLRNYALTIGIQCKRWKQNYKSMAKIWPENKQDAR